MTAAMRALPIALGPRVIRVGVVRGGRVVEERVIKERITVTVGSGETAMFMVSAPAFPAVFALFERSGEGYRLNVLEGMKGRIALPDRIANLEELRGQRVVLGNDARGKVIIGDTTLLFQLVAPPPQPTRPQLPLAVKGGLATKNDWALTFIVAFSFLAHFGLVGAMYSDWSDPIVGDHDVAGLVDMISKIPPPPVEVPDESKPTSVTNAPAPPQPENVKPAPGPVANHHPSPNPSPSPPAPMSDARTAALAARGEAMQIQIVAGLNAGPSVQIALERSSVPGVDLSSAAERNVGAVRSGSELKTAGGGPVQASNHNGLGTLGNVHADSNGNQPGKETNVGSPIPIAQVGISTTTVAIPNVDSTVAGLRGRFRSCYQTGLLSDSTMAGKVMISAKVGPNGEVISSDIVSIAGLSPAVGQCIAGVVKRATFSGPGGGGAVVQIPVTFLQQAPAR